MNADQQQPWEPQGPDFTSHGAPQGQWPPQDAPAPGQPSGSPSGTTRWAAPGQPSGSPSGTTRWRLAAVGAVTALALGAGAAGAAATVALTSEKTVYASPTAVSGTASPGTAAQVAAAVQPSVVSIQARTASGVVGGSGVILRSDGVILTNAHVVSGAREAAVKFSDGRTAAAQVLGADTDGDIAVLKAQGVSGLKPATLGDSSRLAVGDPVLAVGSPLGLDGSVTSGIVSGLGRQVQEGDSDGPLPPGLRGRLSQEQRTVIENAIQTDAAINVGNSGGALVNASGQVIGINTAIATAGGGDGNIGVGFAIPVDSARKSADKIIAGASV